MADEVTTVKRVSVDLFVPDAPGYPEELHPFPENYTIYVPSDQYNPLEKVVESSSSNAN